MTSAPGNETVFRKVALDRLSSPEQLDQLMQVTGPRSWIALAALGLVVATAVVWGFTGTIPTRVEGQGVLIDAGSGLEALIYVPPKDGNHVATGMEVQISPVSAPREEYGFIDGQLTSVAQVPSTRQEMEQALASESLAQTLSAEGAPFAVRARLFPKPGTKAGYRWSSPKGEALIVAGGMLCRVTITVRTRRPIDLLVPTLREKLGL